MAKAGVPITGLPPQVHHGNDPDVTGLVQKDNCASQAGQGGSKLGFRGEARACTPEIRNPNGTRNQKTAACLYCSGALAGGLRFRRRDWTRSGLGSRVV